MTSHSNSVPASWNCRKVCQIENRIYVVVKFLKMFAIFIKYLEYCIRKYFHYFVQEEERKCHFPNNTNLSDALNNTHICELGNYI